MTMQRTKTTGTARRVLLLTTVAAFAGLATSAVDARVGNVDQPARHNPGIQMAARSDAAKLVEQAKQALAQHHPDVAAIFLRSALAEDPDNGDLHLQLGIALFESGDPASAEEELRTARRKGAPDAKVLPVLFGVMLARSEDQQLLTQFPAPGDTDKSPLASDILRARASALLRTGRPKDATDALDRALSIDRSVANLTTRAQLALTLGQRPLALKLLDEALSKSPKEAAALILKVDALLQDKQVDKALDAANQLVSDYPGNAQALITRARVFFQGKENTKALADIDASLKLAPGMPLALFYKAVLVEQANDINQAWQLTQGLPPAFVNSRPEIGLTVAQFAIKAGHAEIGTSILASVAAHFPKDVNVRARLASRYLELKDTKRALETLQPMADSKDPRIVLLLAQAYQMQQQYTTAAEYLQKARDEGWDGDALKRQIAVVNMKSGKIDKAVRELEELNSAKPGDPTVAGPLIAALIDKNDVAKAREITDKLASAAPNQPFGPYYRGQIALREGDLDKAVSAFSRAIKLDPKYVPALYQRASAYGARGDLKSAEDDLRSILSVDPKNLMAEVYLAQMALRSGQKDSAKAALTNAANTHPDVALPMLILASLDMQQGHFDEASAAVEKFLSKNPNNPDALSMRGEIFLVSGKVDEAVKTFTDLARDQPKSTQLQLLLASALTKAGRTQDAVEAYRRALELSPAMPAPHLGLIQLSLANKDDAGAIAAAKDFAEKEPGPVSAQTLASTYMSLKKVDDAKNVLLQTQQKYPNSATLVTLTRVMRMQGEAAQADSMLIDWIGKHPKDVNVRLDYAAVHLQADPAAAEAQYHAVLELQPYNLGALNNLAWILQQRKPEDALPYAERALKIAPDAPAVLDTLGWTKYLANDKTGALPLLERAHAGDPGNGDIGYHLALALDGNGRHADAKKILAAALASKQQFQSRKQAELLGEKWQQP